MPTSAAVTLSSARVPADGSSSMLSRNDTKNISGKKLQYGQDAMTAVGRLQITEQNVVLYPIDNRDRNSHDNHQEQADISAKEIAYMIPGQLFNGRFWK